MSTEPNAAPAAASKKSRTGLLIVLTLVVILLLGGGGGAYWFMFRGAGDAAAAEAEPPAPTGVIPLDPFVVNLADATGSRFLRVTLSLVVADKAIAHEVEEDEVVVLRVRSAILELLAQKQASELVTPDGKAALKKSIAEAVKHTAHELEVADVLFSEFIVQF